jgi:hypothetical protein
MKQSIATDTLSIILPPSQLVTWLAKVFEAKKAKGEEVPAEFERWLKRVQDHRQGITTEFDVLTDDEWKEIGSYLKRATK